MKKLLILFLGAISLFFFVSCTSIEDNPEKTVDYLKKIDSYSCNLLIKTSNAVGETTYDCHQYYDENYGHRLDLDGDRIIIYGINDILINDLNNGIVYSSDTSYDQVFKLSFLQEYIGLLYINEAIEYTFIEENGVKYQLIEVDLPGNNRNLSSAVMYVDIDQMVPTKTVVFDYKENEKVTYLYENFDTEIVLDEDIFSVEETFSIKETK